jgi:hypothetical protein
MPAVAVAQTGDLRRGVSRTCLLPIVQQVKSLPRAVHFGEIQNHARQSSRSRRKAQPGFWATRRIYSEYCGIFSVTPSFHGGQMA